MEIVPAAQHDIAYLSWLAQAAIRYGRDLLHALAMEPEGPKPEVPWPVKKDPETGEVREREFDASSSLYAHGAESRDALDALIAAEDAEQRQRTGGEELQRCAYERVKSKRTREIIDALLVYMERTGASYTAARKAVAEELGIRPGTIDKHFCQLRVDRQAERR